MSVTVEEKFNNIVEIENKVRWIHGYLVATQCAPMARENLNKIFSFIEELYYMFEEPTNKAEEIFYKNKQNENTITNCCKSTWHYTAIKTSWQEQYAQCDKCRSTFIISALKNRMEIGEINDKESS